MCQTEKVRRCEDIIGYEFRDKDLAWEALQCAGPGGVNDRVWASDGNKRLAIVGDAAISLIAAAKDWYYEGHTRGETPDSYCGLNRLPVSQVLGV